MEQGLCWPLSTRKQSARPYDLKKKLAVRSACTSRELHRFEGDTIADDRATVLSCRASYPDCGVMEGINLVGLEYEVEPT